MNESNYRQSYSKILMNFYHLKGGVQKNEKSIERDMIRRYFLRSENMERT